MDSARLNHRPFSFVLYTSDHSLHAFPCIGGDGEDGGDTCTCAGAVPSLPLPRHPSWPNSGHVMIGRVAQMRASNGDSFLLVHLAQDDMASEAPAGKREH